MSTPTWYRSGCNNFDWQRAKITASDFNADGRTDAMVLYDYSTGTCSADSGLLEFGSTGTAFSPSQKWYDSGCGGFEWTRARIASGNYSNSSNDVAVLYDYSSATCAANTSVLVWKSPGTGLNPATHWWDGGCNNLDFSLSKLVSGDTTGDGVADVAVLYNYAATCSAESGIIGFKSTMSAFNSAFWWNSGCGNWDWTLATAI